MKPSDFSSDNPVSCQKALTAFTLKGRDQFAQGRSAAGEETEVIIAVENQKGDHNA